MKTKILTTIACIIALPFLAAAQTITANPLAGVPLVNPSVTNTAPAAPTTVPTFFQSAQSYFTSFNPAYTWTNVTVEASTGYKQVTGAGATDVAQGQYDFNRFNLGAVIGFDGVGSAVGSLQAQFGYDLIQYEDTKLTIDAQAGYSWYQSAAVIEPELAVEKKLTANTFTRIGVSLPYYAGKPFGKTPSFEVSLGFTF